MTGSPARSQPTTCRLTLRTGQAVNLHWEHVCCQEGDQTWQGQGQDAQPEQSPPSSRRCCVIVLVHGGPGLEESHKDLLAAFAAPQQVGAASLAHGLRRAFPGGVVFLGYDQLGCGESDKPADALHYSLKAYVEELEDVLTWAASEQRDWGNGGRADNAGRHVFVLGHSFGGQVVLELLMSGAPSAVGLLLGAVVSNSPLDEATYEQRHLAHHTDLPDDLRRYLEEQEEEAAHNGSVGSLVYRTLIGRSEREITGSMLGWSAISRLPEALEARDGLPLPPKCLLVVAGADATESPEEAMMPCVRACREVDVVVVDEADHFPFYGGSAGVYFEAIASFMEAQA